MKDNVSLILAKFTTIIINTIIAMPFASNNLFHVKVININSPGSNPKSNHINIHIAIDPHTPFIIIIIIDPHTHVFVILNITYHIYFVNPINVSAHSISYAGFIWITVSMHIPSLHINSVKCLSNLQLGKGDTTNNINGILSPYKSVRGSPPRPQGTTVMTHRLVVIHPSSHSDSYPAA